MTRRPPPWILALAGVVLLFVLAALVSAKAVAQGWLAGFIVVSNFPVGAVVLLMIGRLTGGRWVEVFGPELRRLAAWTPWLFLFAAPFLIAPQLVFQWAETPEKTPDLLKAYLSPVVFAVRTLIALGVWSGFGLAFSRGRPGPATAGLGLTLHGLMLVLIPNDWILSLHPGWTTSNIPMIGAAMQILSACALILIRTRGQPAPASADLAGFVAAMVLALVYLGFMAFLVVWYGDIPNRSEFFFVRRPEPWTYAPLLAVVLGVVSLSIMGLDALRFGPGRFVWAALSAMAGFLVFLAWLLGPNLVPPAFAIAVLAIAVQLAWLFGPPAWPGVEPFRKPRHA
jgi:hypothetical protein